MKPTGKVNLIGLAMVVAVIGGLYWLALFGPLYIDNLDVKQAVRETYNSWATTGLEAGRQMLTNKLADSKFGTHPWEDPQTGTVKELPGLPINDEDIVITYDEVRKNLTISVSYERVVTLFPTDKKRRVHFLVEQSGNPYK